MRPQRCPHCKRLKVFDSLGVSEETVKDRLGKIKGDCLFNKDRYQAPGTNTCGKHAVFFAISRLSNHDENFEDVLETYFQADNLLGNEKRVEDWWTSGELSAVLD